jgi:hypothetical protein
MLLPGGTSLIGMPLLKISRLQVKRPFSSINIYDILRRLPTPEKKGDI